MNELRDVLQRDSHHAYLLEGEKEYVLPDLLALIQATWHIEVRGTADCLLFERDGFDIEDAHTLRQFTYGKALGGGKKVGIVVFSSITTEAQNAILKTLEEPIGNTHFFFVVSHADILSPTVLSRLYRVRPIYEDVKEKDELAKKFVAASKPKRLDMIGEIAKAKDKEQALSLVSGIEAYLYSKEKDKAQSATLYEELEKVRGYLRDRSPSVKVLLEHLSLTLP